jgi:hypothetical protein
MVIVTKGHTLRYFCKKKVCEFCCESTHGKLHDFLELTIICVFLGIFDIVYMLPDCNIRMYLLLPNNTADFARCFWPFTTSFVCLLGFCDDAYVILKCHTHMFFIVIVCVFYLNS